MYNVANLKKLRSAIESHGPEHFDMEAWFSRSDNDRNYEFDLWEVDEIDIDNCGTTACVAGHCVLLMMQEGFTKYIDVSDIGDWLGVPESERVEEQAPSLFYRYYWNSIHPDVMEIKNSIDSDYEAVLQILDWMIKRAEGVANV